MANEPQLAVRITAKGSEDVRAHLSKIKAEAGNTFSGVGSAASAAGTAVTKTVTAATSATKGLLSVAQVGLGLMGSLVNGVTGLVGTAISSVNTMAGAFGAAGAVATVGVGGLVYAAKSYAQSVAEGVSEAKGLAESVGLSVEELTRLQAVVRLAGGDSDKFGQGLQAMNRKVLDLAQGNDQAVEAFDQLGLSIANFRDKKGGLLGTRQQLDVILDRLQKIKNPALQSKAAFDVLGKSGKEMGVLFSDGAKGLREAEAEVGRYGTTLSTDVAEEMDELLGDQLKLQESLKGLGLSFARIFYPFFAASAENMSKWLNSNRDKIAGWLEKIKEYVENLRDDIVNLLTGKGGEFNFAWIGALQGPLKVLKGVVLDVFDALKGDGFGERVPEVKAFAEAVQSAWQAALALGKALLESSGVALDDLPTVRQVLVGLKGALDAFRAGLEGVAANAEFAWAANLGEAAKAAAGAVGTLVRLVVANKDSITRFIKEGMKGLADAMRAVESLINGQPIDGKNKFAFLDDWKVRVENAVTFITKWFDILTGDFQRAAGTLGGMAEGAFNVLDKVGKFLGFGDGTDGSAGRELAIVVGILAVTGALNLLVALASGIAALAAAFGSLLGILATVGGWFMALVNIGAAATGGLAVLWAAFWALMAYLVYEGVAYILKNWDDIKAGAKALWDLVAALARAAWDSVKGLWGGLADMLAVPIEAAKKLFSKLWDSVKNGAAGAWSWVKSAFGLGGSDQPAMAGAGEGADSYDVGGIVPGSRGAPRRAVVHGGERILTLAETDLFHRLMSGLGAMTGFDASSDFAAAPLAVPARAGGGSNLMGGGLTVSPGDRTLYATQAGWQELRRALQRGGMGVRTQRARR